MSAKADEATPLLPSAQPVTQPAPLQEVAETAASPLESFEALDHALPDNKAKELLVHDLAASRVRLANWSKRLQERRRTLSRLVVLQLISSIVATLFATLAAIMSTIAANGDTKPTHSALNIGAVVAISNALFGALASILASILGQIRRGQEDEKEPETSQAKVAQHLAWRQEAHNYVFRFKDRWLSSLEEDIKVLSGKLPADVPL